jgi:predicted  nucleic acid-binding Zn-ribbon protein
MSNNVELLTLNDKLVEVNVEIRQLKNTLIHIQETLEFIKARVGPKRSAQFRALKAEQTRKYHQDLKKYKTLYEDAGTPRPQKQQREYETINYSF